MIVLSTRTKEERGKKAVGIAVLWLCLLMSLTQEIACHAGFFGSLFGETKKSYLSIKT